MPLPQQKLYTIKDIYALPEGTRAELVDGQIYMMAPPTRKHQDITFALSRKIADYIDSKHGSCKTYIAPFAVFLNQDDKNYVEPDISVICDRDKLNDKGCVGAPDWIIEIVSPGSRQQYNHFTTFSTILYIGNEIRIKIRILSVKVSGFPRPASRGESQ